MLRRYTEGGTLRDSVALALAYFEPWSGPPEGDGYEGWNLPPRPRHMTHGHPCSWLCPWPWP